MYDASKAYFNEKNLYNWTGHELASMTLRVEKAVLGLETYWIVNKNEKNSGRSDLTVFCRIKGLISIDFFEKGAIVNNTLSYLPNPSTRAEYDTRSIFLSGA